jgi:superfamily II DNA/RNA helicase
MGISEPGSGKTLAYLLPIVARLTDTENSAKPKVSGLQLLVLLPTRFVVVR